MIIACEQLENRCLLTATLKLGILTVTGTNGAETIALSNSGTSIRVAIGTTFLSFKASSVSKIVVRGLDGNDTITLNTVNKPSLLDGGAGNDTITGGAGSDTILGGLGADVMKGGAKSDTVDYSASRANLTVTIDGVANDGAANERDNVQADIENVIGGVGNDKITGSSAANELRGGPGNDTLAGGAGDDDLYGDLGNDILTGNAGADWLIGGDGIDMASYAEKINPLTITMGNDSFDDGESGEGDNVDSSIENLIGGSAGDNVTGNILPNVLDGAAGNDTLAGASGDDTLLGNIGDDSLTGDDGADLIVGGVGADFMRGGFGVDKVDYSTRTNPLIITADGVADDGESGELDNVQNDVENIVGGAGDDNITGDSLANILDGGAGDDVLSGLGGNDTINGGLGNDDLVGGSGSDELNGGLETDTADYTSDTNGITVTIDGVANDGEGGDNVQLDIENVTGGSGDDDITGSAAANVLDGGAGFDTLRGGAGDDRLLGGADDDELRGGDGNDTLMGQTGDDTLRGDLGNDTADYSDRSADLNISLDNVNNDGDTLLGEKDDVRDDVETIVAGSGNDTLTGSDFGNRLVGGDGNDSLDGGRGDDTLVGGVGGDILRGGSGIDTADYSARSNALVITIDGNPNDGEANELDNVRTDVENVIGGSAGDQITGSNSANNLQGMAGDDTLDGGTGGDTLSGGAGNDRVTYNGRSNPLVIFIDGAADSGEAGEGDTIPLDVENITGGSGNDTIRGSAAANDLDGGAGDDVLDGGAGNDTLHGSAGDDRLMGELGADDLNGGDGIDTATYVDHAADVKVTIDDLANDGLSGELDNLHSDVENVEGGSGNDNITGSALDNVLNGGGGNDILSGGAGNDTLLGRAGSDQLLGGDGNDLLEANDGSGDVLDGGNGVDSTHKDALDTLVNVETIL